MLFYIKRFLKQFVIIVKIYNKLKNTIYRFRREQTTDELIRKIVNYYKNNEFYRESIDFFKKNGFSCFPFFWTKEYDDINIDVFNDNGFPYVIHKHKKLFFPKTMDENIVRERYKGLLIEQDKRSSHVYFSKSFKLSKDSIFFDVGCAEAIIALENIDVIKKAYLFECDNLWIEALNKTFEPYKDKIQIICKYVADKNSKNSITLDSITKKIDISESLLIKADIEGFESKVLKGAKKTFNKFSDVKISICTYHRINDKKKITKVLNKNFDIEYSDSYMIWPWLARKYRLKPPYFVSGILRATKK